MVVKPEKKEPDFGQVRVFVYGTLKTKNGNNFLLRESGAKFLGFDALHLPQATFIDLGGFPAIVQPLGGTGEERQVIRGEVWYGSSEILKNLDILEGHPHFFRRSKQWSVIHNRRVWVYALPEDWIAEGEDFMDESTWKPSDEETAFWKAYCQNNKGGLVPAVEGEING